MTRKQSVPLTEYTTNFKPISMEMVQKSAHIKNEFLQRS